MSLTLNPGLLPPQLAPTGRSPRTTPVQPPQVEPVIGESATSRETKRSADYAAAVRELREEQQSPRQTLATRTYLQIAHYEGEFPLVDVYS